MKVLSTGFTFSYYCEYDKKEITETIAYKSKEKNLWVCESCAVYSTQEIQKMHKGETIITNPHLLSIESLNLTEYYKKALIISAIPRSEMTKEQSAEAEPAYSKLIEFGFYFSCGELCRRKM